MSWTVCRFLSTKKISKAFHCQQLRFILQEGIPGWGRAGLQSPWLPSVPNGFKKEIWNVLQSWISHRNTDLCYVFFNCVCIFMAYHLPECVLSRCLNAVYIKWLFQMKSCDFAAFNRWNFLQVCIFSFYKELLLPLCRCFTNTMKKLGILSWETYADSSSFSKPYPSWYLVHNICSLLQNVDWDTRKSK